MSPELDLEFGPPVICKIGIYVGDCWIRIAQSFKLNIKRKL